MYTISNLYIYPVKSLGGIAVDTAQVTDRGLEHDRRWMLVNSQNRFLSQRELPEMALLKTAVTPGGISVTHNQTKASYIIPYKPLVNEFAEVTIWDDTCTAQLVSAEADAWFSDILKQDCRLVYMPDDTRRPVDPDYAAPQQTTSFADAFPFLLISQATLNDLSQRIGEPIPMNRFRPNIVFTGSAPFAEDQLAHFTIGYIHFYGVKLCARCPIPGIEQDTAQRVKEPLKTLASYRRKQNKVYVGQNLIHTGQGQISVGDDMKVLEQKEAAAFDVSI